MIARLGKELTEEVDAKNYAKRDPLVACVMLWFTRTPSESKSNTEGNISYRAAAKGSLSLQKTIRKQHAEW